MMTSYKLVTVSLSLPIGSRLRKSLHEFTTQIIGDVYLDVHRHCLASATEWWDMTIDDMLALVEKIRLSLATHEKTKVLREGGEGRRADEETKPVIRSRL
jgi:hypothetical protein